MQSSSWVTVVDLCADGHRIKSHVGHIFKLLFAIVNMSKIYYYYCCFCFWEELITYNQILSMLNLSDVTSKICAVTMFVIVDFKTVFHV